jgi:hypothetical protein
MVSKLEASVKPTFKACLLLLLLWRGWISPRRRKLGRRRSGIARGKGMIAGARRETARKKRKRIP